MLDGGLAKPRAGGRAEGVAGLLSSCHRHYSTTRAVSLRQRGFLVVNIVMHGCTRTLIKHVFLAYNAYKVPKDK